jgi:hypothetical protein
MRHVVCRLIADARTGDVAAMLLDFGTYLIEPAPVPSHLGLSCERLLTATGCLCEMHPLLAETLWEGPGGVAYQAALGLDDGAFTEMREDVSRLFDADRLDWDGRFSERTDALAFAGRHLSRRPRVQAVSLALDEADHEAFLAEVGRTLTARAFGHAHAGGEFLGYDILGWDFSGFHSYLCNSLHSLIARSHRVLFGDNGLLRHSYPQVREFADLIAGTGEPVAWFPFAVHRHSLTSITARRAG